MKRASKIEKIKKRYFHRLLTDRSVDDVMPFFVAAKNIFDKASLIKKSRKKH
jgi:hypothetical protein